MSTLLRVKRPFSPARAGRFALVLTGAVLLGAAIAYSLPLGFLALAAAVVLFAMCELETLSVLVFWALPYMSLNLPTGSFTLKLCDGTAYLFAGAWAVRAGMRGEKVALPPATVQVIVFLAALSLSALYSPIVPDVFVGDMSATNRNAPTFRSFSIIVWLALSWVLVTAIYNIVGSRAGLYKRCICAHILSGGLACAISLTMYAMGLFGFRFNEIANGRSLIFDAGSYLRLAGVAYEPLFLGFYLLTVIPVTITVRSLHPDWLPKRLLSLSLGLQLTAMALTFSSGGWAGLLVALTVLALLLRPRVIRPGVIAAALAVPILIGIACVVAPKIQSVLADPLTKITRGGDDIRKREWKVGYNLIEDYPVLGVGPGLARFYFARYHDVMRAVPASLDEEVNNAYINVMAEEGVVGFLAFAWCALAGIEGLALPIRRFGPKRVPVLCALFSSLVGIAAQYNSLNSLFLVFFPVLIGLACAAARLAPTGVELPAETSRMPVKAVG